jgi:hypothetical protein
LFATEYKRFRRQEGEERFIHDFLRKELNAKLSGRTERRYRRPTSSEPHVNTLIHLTVAHVARYTDSLRTGGALFSDRGRFSLESLLNASHLEDALVLDRSVQSPAPSNVWNARREEFVEWPPLLSLRFPKLQQWDDRVIRLAEGSAVKGLAPSIGPGSWMLLGKAPMTPETLSDRGSVGWSRPLYVLRRGFEMFCGYLGREGDRYALLSNTNGGDEMVAFRADELPLLSRVSGVAVPV